MTDLVITEVPLDLYRQIEGWAAAAGRSLSDEVIAVIEREVDRQRPSVLEPRPEDDTRGDGEGA